MSQHSYSPAPGPQAEGPRARHPIGAAARSFSNLPTGPLPTDTVAGTSAGRGRSSALSHPDPLGQSDPTARETDFALNSAVPTADSAKLAASVDFSPCQQDQRLIPAGPNHSGAAIVLPNTVGEATGQEQGPFPAAIVDACYGLASKTMTIYHRDSTPTEATPSSVSDHRLARARTGITSGSSGWRDCAASTGDRADCLQKEAVDTIYHPQSTPEPKSQMLQTPIGNSQGGQGDGNVTSKTFLRCGTKRAQPDDDEATGEGATYRGEPEHADHYRRCRELIGTAPHGQRKLFCFGAEGNQDKGILRSADSPSTATNTTETASAAVSETAVHLQQLEVNADSAVQMHLTGENAVSGKIESTNPFKQPDSNSEAEAATNEESPTADWNTVSEPPMTMGGGMVWPQYNSEPDKTVYIAQPVSNSEMHPELVAILNSLHRETFNSSSPSPGIQYGDADGAARASAVHFPSGLPNHIYTADGPAIEAGLHLPGVDADGWDETDQLDANMLNDLFEPAEREEMLERYIDPSQPQQQVEWNGHMQRWIEDQQAAVGTPTDPGRPSQFEAHAVIPRVMPGMTRRYEADHIDLCMELADTMADRARDGRLDACPAAQAYVQISDAFPDKTRPAKDKVLHKKLVTLAKTPHRTAGTEYNINALQTAVLRRELSLPDEHGKKGRASSQETANWNHCIRFLATMGQKADNCTVCANAISFVCMASNAGTATAYTPEVNSTVTVDLTMTDLTIWSNYALLLLALLGVVSVIALVVTSLTPASLKDSETVAKLRYETLRLNDHLRRLREGEAQNMDTMDRQSNAIRVANTKLNRLHSMLQAREQRLQRHVTTVFGYPEAEASSDDLQPPPPIRVQVIPESKAGKSNTIIYLENVNPDTMQLAAFQAEICAMTGLKPDQQRFQIMSEGKMIAMKPAVAVPTSPSRNTDERIEEILNDTADATTEPEPAPSMNDLGFMTLREAGYQTDDTGREFDIRLIAKLKGGVATQHGPRTRSAEAAAAAAGPMLPRTRSGRVANHTAISSPPMVPPRSPSRRAILMADSETSEDDLPPTQQCMNPACDAVWHCPLEPPPMAELCGECYTTHELCTICDQSSAVPSQEETPATPQHQPASSSSGAQHPPMIPGSARTPFKAANTSYLRKLLRLHQRIIAQGLDMFADPAVTLELRMRSYHAIIEAIERTCTSPTRGRALCNLLYHPGGHGWPDGGYEYLPAESFQAMTMLEGYAIPLDQAALKTFLESIAVHYQCIALHILGPSPESSVPGQEYPCHLCNEHYTTVPDAGADASPNMFRMACQQCIMPTDIVPSVDYILKICRGEHAPANIYTATNQGPTSMDISSNSDSDCDSLASCHPEELAATTTTTSSAEAPLISSAPQENIQGPQTDAEKEELALQQPLPETPMESRPTRSRQEPERFTPSPNAVRQESISTPSLVWLQTTVSSTNSSPPHSEGESTPVDVEANRADPNAHMLTEQDSSFKSPPTDVDDSSEDSISLSDDSSVPSQPSTGSSNNSTPMRQSKITEFLAVTPPSRDPAAKKRLATLQNPDGSPIYLDSQRLSAKGHDDTVNGEEDATSDQTGPKPAVIDLEQEITPKFKFEKTAVVDLTDGDHKDSGPTAAAANDVAKDSNVQEETPSQGLQELHQHLQGLGFTEIDSDDEIIQHGGVHYRRLPTPRQSKPPCGLHGCDKDCQGELVNGANVLYSFCSAEHEINHKRDMEKEPLSQPKWQPKRHRPHTNRPKSVINWNENHAMDWLVENLEMPALIDAAIQLKPTGCDLLTASTWQTLGRLAIPGDNHSITDATSMQMHKECIKLLEMHMHCTKENADSAEDTADGPEPEPEPYTMAEAPPATPTEVGTDRDVEGTDSDADDHADADEAQSQGEPHQDDPESDDPEGADHDQGAVKMYCHLIVPLNSEGLELISSSMESHGQTDQWIQLLAREPDEIVSADPAQGIVLVNRTEPSTDGGRLHETAALLVHKDTPGDWIGNSTGVTTISPIQGPRGPSQQGSKKRYPPTYDWEWQLPKGTCPTDERSRRIFFTSTEFEEFLNNGKRNRWGSRCQVLHYDSQSRSVHVAVILTAPQAAAIADIEEFGPYLSEPKLISFQNYFGALQHSPDYQFTAAHNRAERSSGRYLGHQVKQLIRSMSTHMADPQQIEISRSTMRMNEEQSTVVQPYTQRNLFENEKALIDRMVTRLKQLLEHVRPWEPDDKDYVPFDKFNGYDDILYDVYYQGIFEIMRDDAITSRNTSDQRRIMHAIILATLSKHKLIASDPQSSPWFYWTSCQQRYASQKRMHSTKSFSSEAWMPIETLTSTDTSFTTPETGEIDVNKGGVTLLKERFPLKSVPTYMFNAVEKFRITQFLDIDEIKNRFNKQLQILEDTQQKFPLVQQEDVTEEDRACNSSTWSGANPEAHKMKIADIAHQVTAMYEREVALFNQSKLTKLERRAAIPERTPFWKRMLLSLGNTLKGERVTPANMWKYLKYHVEEASFVRLGEKGEHMSHTDEKIKLVDYLHKHKVAIPGRHFSPVPLSAKWLTHLGGQDRFDTGSGAPTEYSYVTTLGSNIRRPRSFPPSTGKKHGPRNSRNQVMRIGFDTEPALQTRLPDPEPERQPPTPVDMRTHRQSIKFIESTPLPASMNEYQCTEPGIQSSAMHSYAMALYTREQEAPARIRSLIGQAIGSDAVLVNDKLLVEHKARTDASRKKDYDAGPQRDEDGRVKWSANSTSMMRALRIRTLFMMGEIDLKALSPIEKKWAFTEYDHINRCPHCTLCGSKEHVMPTCPDFHTKTTPWRKGGELHTAYKQKWRKAEETAQLRSRSEGAKTVDKNNSRSQGRSKKFEPTKRNQSFR